MEYYDELVSNFDLNHLLGENEENVQVPPQPERAKNAALWLKSKIISSDMLIQNYLTKSEDFVQAVKAHAVTKEDLKHVCINYKETLEKCEALENEKKVLIANQEVLQNKAADAENNYSALISHTNQLKSLVQQLKTEKEALLLEKRLEKTNDKKVKSLQKEKEALLNDIVNLKEALRSKKKKGKMQVKGLKKYGKQKQSDGSIICTSDESDNENNSIHEIHNYASKHSVSNSDHHFVDNDSDSSNEQASVDTGRGSSRANSEKCLLSPDYYIPETPLRTPDINMDAKKVDVASSPIMISRSVSVATSPNGFDYSTTLFEDLYGHEKDGSFNGPDYIIDDVPICGENVTINESLVDACTSPIPISPDIRKFVDIGTDPINSEINTIFKAVNKEKKSLPVDLLEINESNKETIFNANQSAKGVRGNQKPLVDVGTNTDPKPPDLRIFVDKETNTTNNGDGINHTAYHKKHVRKSLFSDEDDIEDCNQKLANKKELKLCEKSTNTQIEITDACTSPVSKSFEVHQLIDRGTSPIQHNNTMTEKSPEQSNQDSVDSVEVQTSQEFETSTSRNKSVCKTPDLLTQEKRCLENHNSTNLRYGKSNDSEIQHILNVMKLHSKALSPLPKTPLKIQETQSTTIETLLSDYETSALKFNQLMNYMEDFRGLMSRNVAELRNKCNSNISQDFCDVPIAVPIVIDDVVETSELITNNEKEIAQTKQITSNHEINEEFETDMAETNLSSNVGERTEDYTCNKIVEIVVPSKPEIEEHNKTTKVKETTKHIELNEDEEIIINKTNTNGSEIHNGTENQTEMDCSEMPIVKKVNVPKIRKISKLEKLRHKLIPTSKIKSISPPAKHPPKICKVTLKDDNSPSLDHELAYQKAVKVMAELRSHKKDEERNKVQPTHNLTSQVEKCAILENLNKTDISPKRDLFASNIATRSSTKSQSEKVRSIDTNTAKIQVVSEKVTQVVEKSPVRKGCKRVADNELDRMQGRKRMLRSSKNSQSTDNQKSELITVPTEDLNHSSHDNEGTNTSKYDESIEKVNDLMETENEHCMFADNVQNSCVGLVSCETVSNIRPTIIQNSPIKSVKCNHSLETATAAKEKSVIKLSQELNQKCAEQDTSTSLNETVDNSGKIQLGEEQNCNSKIGGDEMSVEPLQAKPRDDDNLKVQHSHIAITKESDTKLLERKLRSDIGLKRPVVEVIPLENDVVTNCTNSAINYKDLDMFTEQPNSEDKVPKKPSKSNQQIKENILCSALERYGVISVKFTAKKVPDSITNSICQKIEDGITDIIASPKDQQKKKMEDLSNSIRNSNTKSILSGLMKYLKDPTRKCELFNKIETGPAPPMTKSEVILLYIIEHLNGLLPSGFIHRLWNNIEHALFQLNHAPHFDIIESMSHFYAVTCTYFRNKSRLRCFMLDAMYCLQFKAVPLIKQCLDVCPTVLPKAHEHMAKTSLVTCLVYLLHFYKCQDKYNRAQNIRNILFQKYSFRFSEWNETMILEIFRKAIMDLRGTNNDKKMLRLALIILCKRHGAKWCHTNIIRNMLLPIIEKQHVPDRTKQFCVLMLGPLLKPFPADKKAQCEIVINQLLLMLQQTPSHDMMEAIYSSLIFMNKHDPDRVVSALLAWNPKNVSKDFEDTLNDYVMEKPLMVWKKLVTRKPSVCT